MGDDFANNPIGAILSKGRKEIWLSINYKSINEK